MSKLSVLLAKANQISQDTTTAGGKNTTTPATTKTSVPGGQTTVGNSNTKPTVSNSGHSQDHGSSASGQSGSKNGTGASNDQGSTGKMPGSGNYAGNSNTKPTVTNSGHSNDHASTASGNTTKTAAGNMGNQGNQNNQATKPGMGNDKGNNGNGSDFSPAKGGVPPGQAKQGQGDYSGSGKDGMPMTTTGKPYAGTDKTGMPGTFNDMSKTDSGMPGNKPHAGNNGKGSDFSPAKGGTPPGQAKQGQDDCGCHSKDSLPMPTNGKHSPGADKAGMPGTSNDMGQTNSGMPGNKPHAGNNGKGSDFSPAKGGTPPGQAKQGQGDNSSAGKDGLPPGQSKQGDCNCNCHQGGGNGNGNKTGNPGNSGNKTSGGNGDLQHGQAGSNNGNSGNGGNTDHGKGNGAGNGAKGGMPDVVAFDLSTIGEMVGALYGSRAGSYVRDMVAQEMKRGFIDPVALADVLTDIKSGQVDSAEMAYVTQNSPLLDIVLVGLSPVDVSVPAIV